MPTHLPEVCQELKKFLIGRVSLVHSTNGKGLWEAGAMRRASDTVAALLVAVELKIQLETHKKAIMELKTKISELHKF